MAEFMKNIKGYDETMKNVEEKEFPVIKYETRRSKKTGNDFDCLVIYYRGYQKLVFLNQAEQFMFSDLK